MTDAPEVAEPLPVAIAPSIGRGRLVALLDRLADIGARPTDTHDERLREGALILSSVLITILSFVWVVTYATLGLWVSAAIPAAYQLATVVGLIVLARTKRFDVYRTMQLVMFLFLPALLQVSLGGFLNSSAIVMWSTLTPLAALALFGTRGAIPWLAAYLVEVIALAALEPRISPPEVLPTALVVSFFVMNLAGVMLGTFLLLGYFVHQRELAHQALRLERERSERLLLNVLPAPIAERLKQNEGVIAERHEDVSVLFADLVGFTSLSRNMDPHALVTLLDEIFSAFDAIAEREGLEKIKTVGDAYMLAGGLPEPMAANLEATARAALAMREQLAAVAARQDMGDELAVRIGIDAGPAVAGVIGRRKFIYDLWGDTVNTASRMESHGLPGEIQLTERAADRLATSFEVRKRGEIEVKGKGPMSTYLLIGRRQPSTRA